MRSPTSRHARDTLEADGPSADLALAYMRIAGLHKFEFDERARGRGGRARDRDGRRGRRRLRADLGALLARVLALRHRPGRRRTKPLLDEAFREARERGYSFIAANIAYNDTWTRLHMLRPDVSREAGRRSPARRPRRAVTDLEPR